MYENRTNKVTGTLLSTNPRRNAEDTGAWSSGEFGTILRNLYGAGYGCRFQVRGRRYHRADQASSVYKFAVERLRSSCKYLGFPDNIFFRPTEWVDKQSANTLRIEMQAMGPRSFRASQWRPRWIMTTSRSARHRRPCRRAARADRTSAELNHVAFALVRSARAAQHFGPHRQ